MTTELPAPLREAVDRIDEAPAPLAGDPAAGALGRLDAWWETVSGGDARPVPHEVSPSSSVADPTEPGDRRIEARLLAGLSAADRAVDSGATVIVTAAPGDDVPARAVIALLAWREASTLLPQPPGTSDAEWMRRCARVRDVAAAARSVRADTVALLSVTQADDVAFAAGVLLGAAARRTPCLVDGTTALSGAVVADRISYRARGWWLAASDSPDPGRSAAIDRVDLAVALPLQTADDSGLAARAVLALLALP